MKISKALLICLCCMVAAPAVWGQAASAAKPGILGYLDPQTGAFRPVTQAVDDSEMPLTLTTFTGTINLTITVTVKSTGITSVTCTMSTTVEDALTSGSPRILSESNSVSATGTGSTKTCKLSIPYSWGLSTESSDTMSTAYSVVGSASSTVPLPNRTSGLSPVDSRKVPANGTITALTAAVTI